MVVAIIGSRKIKHRKKVHDLLNAKLFSVLDQNRTKDKLKIISGGAAGIDKIVEEFSLSRGIEFTSIVPDYKRYGRAAPIKRNDSIVESCDILIAIWDGKSKGTKYTIDKAYESFKTVIVETMNC